MGEAPPQFPIFPWAGSYLLLDYWTSHATGTIFWVWDCSRLMKLSEKSIALDKLLSSLGRGWQAGQFPALIYTSSNHFPNSALADSQHLAEACKTEGGGAK